MNNYRFGFWTSSRNWRNVPADFGCAVHGFANYTQWVNPQEPLACIWDESLQGSVISGGYDAVLKDLSALKFTPKVCIVFFNKPIGIESFINRLIQIMPDVPLIGGGAATRDGQVKGELMPPGEDVALLAAGHGNFELESLNIYDRNDLSIEIKKNSLRDFEWLRVWPDGEWQNAQNFFHFLKTSLGIESNNFESVTFCDKNDRNIHFSVAGNSIHAGANLPDDDKLYLRVLNTINVEERVANFMSDNRALIFGCAGIRSLIKTPLFTGNNSLAGFMFGELVILNRTPMFGNLMLAKLKVKEKSKYS
jgi:hypothetical protein